MKWTKDGDQLVARGRQGEYRITTWMFWAGETFVLTLQPNGDSEKKQIAEYGTMAGAKAQAVSYDGYRPE